MPITKSLYTEAKYVFQNTFLSGDIDEDKIIPYILRAQELYVFDWLGQSLYEHIDSLIDDETIDDADNSAYKTLATEYIAPCVDYLAAAEYLKYGGYTASENGVYRKSASNATVASQAEVNKLIGALMSTAENKWSVAYDYLCANSSLYPEYTEASTTNRPASHRIFDLGIR